MSIDGKTGHINWTYTPEVDFSQSTGVGGYGITVNRGVAAEDGKLFLLTFDNKLQAISQKTGERLWSSEVEDPATGRLRVDGADRLRRQGLRRRLRLRGRGAGQARRLRPEDRQEDLDLLHRAQGGDRSWVPKGGGGGTIYMPPTIDTETEHVYVGTGNPAPVIVGAKRPGKNLYTDSILALDADTGKLKWYHQEQAHDLWDYDAESPVVLFNAEIEGRRRRGVAEAGKNGLLFLLDAETGKNLFPSVAVREARPHAADDEADARVPRRGRRLAVLAARLQPGNAGGLRLRDQHLHDPQSHLRNRTTARKPSAATAWCRKTPKRPAPSPPSSTITGKVIWKHNMPTPMDGGATATRRRPRLHRRPAGHPLRLRRRERRRPLAGRPETRLRHGAGRSTRSTAPSTCWRRSAAPPSPPPKNWAKSAPAWWPEARRQEAAARAGAETVGPGRAWLRAGAREGTRPSRPRPWRRLRPCPRRAGVRVEEEGRRSRRGRDAACRGRAAEGCGGVLASPRFVTLDDAGTTVTSLLMSGP